MINRESYKVLVAEAGKLALDNSRKKPSQNLFERVFVVKLLMDKDDPKRVAGAVGFSVREHKIYVSCKTALLATGEQNFSEHGNGGRSGRLVPVWNAGSNYAMAESGAEMTMMENRFVPSRFKDGYGPSELGFCCLKPRPPMDWVRIIRSP